MPATDPKKWLEGKVLGKPKATDTYTVEDLEGMGMVGVYAPDPDADATAAGMIRAAAAGDADAQSVVEVAREGLAGVEMSEESD